MSVAFLIGTLGTRAGGIETYETHLLRSLAEIDTETDYHLFCLGRNAQERLAIRQPNFRFTELPFNCRPLNVGAVVPALLMRSGSRLLHPTYIPPAFCPIPFVYTIHSSVTWVHPEFYPRLIRWRLNFLQQKGISGAKLILCVSQHVRNFIEERFRVPPERLAVIYHGVSPSFHQRTPDSIRPALDRYGIDYPYLLFVGKLTENKNIERLLQAFRIFRQKTDPSIRLVLAGRRLWSNGEIDRQLNQALRDGEVIEIGHIVHEDLPPLYNGALGLVFPSLYEGFGLPILEAFASGIPVLTSNNSALTEIAHGHTILVDPLSIEDIAQGMVQLVTDSELRQRLVIGGLQRVRQFSWKRTATETLAAYRQALNP